MTLDASQVQDAKGTQVLTTTGTGPNVPIVAVLLAAVAALVPARWPADAERAWSFVVYYVGYRLLSIQLSCGSMAVTGMPLVVKFATH